MWEPYLYRVEVEVEGRLVRVYAYDQYGNDITGECVIRYEGDYKEEGVGEVRVEGRYLKVRVEYGGKVVEKRLSFGEDVRGGIGEVVVMVAVVLVLVVMVVVVYVYLRRKWMAVEEKGRDQEDISQ